MPPSANTSKFLFSILQLVDTKNINWDEIAKANDIPTANAARVKWKRLKDSMDPSGATPKKPRKALPPGEEEPGKESTPTKKRRKRKATGDETE